MNILYLIDPNSIHDQKWISSFTQNKENRCSFLCREHQFDEEFFQHFEKEFSISFKGSINYFSFKKVRNSIRQLVKIKRIIKENDIQIFHIQYAEPNALWVLFRKFLNIPIVITCRGTDVLKTIPEHFSKNDLFNKLISWSYKKAFQWADWVTVTSSSQMKSVKNFSGREDRISIVRTGVNLEKLYEDTFLNLPEVIKKPYLLFPRYIKPIYNHEFSIEALKMLPADIKQKYQMVFIGIDSGDLDYQMKLIELLESDPLINYIFLPKQKQQGIWELFKKAEVIVMTPKSDGSPVSGMEAIALEKKLILGPLAYDKEIFSERNVYRIKKWDEYELANKIKELILIQKTEFKVSKEYLNKIDTKINMQELYKLYNILVQPN